MSSSDEDRDILEYLRTSPEAFFSPREICRRAGGKQKWEENERWALPVLARMLTMGLIEVDSGGRYRIPVPKSKKNFLSGGT